MPPKEFEIYHGGPVQGRGKSFFGNPGKLSIKTPEGTFKELGKLETIGSLPIAENDGEKWRDGLHSSVSFTCEIKDTPDSRNAMREIRDLCEKSCIEDMVHLLRKFHRRRHFMCTKSQYGHVNRIVHKYHNMNFTRYCRSIGIKCFTGFRVLLDSGYWVKKK